MLILFIDFCNCPWWLPWLLPLLAGLLAGWLLWGRLIAGLRATIADLEAKLKAANARIGSLDGDLNLCNDRNASLNSDIAIWKGRIAELEAAPKAVAPSVVQRVVADVAPEKRTFVTPPTPQASPKVSAYSQIKDDELQIIEGIGEKMSAVLKDNGIRTFAELAAKSPDELRALLDKVDPVRYRIIDPTSWPQQATMANQKRWAELIILQKQLDTGRADTGDGETDAKLEKYMIKMGLLKRWKQDDLKAVEGIGPKIEELLKNAGINTWRALSQTPVPTIQKILTDAGSRFSLADPGTWPKQAEMAADGKWDELQEYQDFLQGGRDSK